eukprot:1183893-Prorocentrum_minimum.AAC.2
MGLGGRDCDFQVIRLLCLYGIVCTQAQFGSKTLSVTQLREMLKTTVETVHSGRTSPSAT